MLMPIKKYSKDELINHAIIFTKQLFCDSENILKQNKTIIHNAVKSINIKVLSDKEINDKSINIANFIFDRLNSIRTDYVSSKLSNEIIEISIYDGIDLSQYDKYFTKLSKEFVKDIIGDEKKRIRNENKSRKMKK